MQPTPNTTFTTSGTSIHPRSEGLVDDCESLDIQSPEPLAQFHPFPRLPTELRLQIWRMTFPPSQIIDTPCFSSMMIYTDGLFRQTQEIPKVLLRTNRESREEMLNHYTIIRRRKNANERLPKVFIFSSKRDVLHIYYDQEAFVKDPFSNLHFDFRGSVSSIRTLELTLSMRRDEDSKIAEKVYKCLLRLSRLEKIYVTHQPSDGMEEEDDVFRDFHQEHGVWDTWISDFREFLFEYRDDFYGGKAPEVIVGPSDAAGTRARRPDNWFYGGHHHGGCRCSQWQNRMDEGWDDL